MPSTTSAMANSPTTSTEDRLRAALLDLVHAQWASLGAAFAVEPAAGTTHEVVDPDALVWCSLEFAEQEPRLREAVDAFASRYRDSLVRLRVSKRLAADTRRAAEWEAVVSPLRRATRTREEREREALVQLALRQRFGNPSTGTTTLLLRAREILGNDVRPFLILSFLAAPDGLALADVQRWSGYLYRNLIDVASRWVRAGVVEARAGRYRLSDDLPWRRLLRHDGSRLALLNWFDAFDACVRCLRDLRAARERGFDETSTPARVARAEARSVLTRVLADSLGSPRSLRTLLAIVSD